MTSLPLCKLFEYLNSVLLDVQKFVIKKTKNMHGKYKKTTFSSIINGKKMLQQFLIPS